MSDYLRRLARRALGLAPLAEPRITPRFSESEPWYGDEADAIDAPIPLLDHLQEPADSHLEDAWQGEELQRIEANDPDGASPPSEDALLAKADRILLGPPPHPPHADGPSRSLPPSPGQRQGHLESYLKDRRAARK